MATPIVSEKAGSFLKEDLVMARGDKSKGCQSYQVLKR
jgi:hypothetical protein